jgi:hypothetical protein
VRHLNSGVPAAEVAKWDGHSYEVLARIYAGCVVGLDDVWIARMNAGLRPSGLSLQAGRGKDVGQFNSIQFPGSLGLL